jgi:hypothetical protein
LFKNQHMDIHRKNKLVRPGPWISSQKNSAHGPGWAGPRPGPLGALVDNSLGNLNQRFYSCFERELDGECSSFSSFSSFSLNVSSSSSFSCWSPPSPPVCHFLVSKSQTFDLIKFKIFSDHYIFENMLAHATKFHISWSGKLYLDGIPSKRWLNKGEKTDLNQSKN